ncbi:MAG TPA: peroxiredoxin [Candidatus Saccharimonadales bacterium]
MNKDDLPINAPDFKLKDQELKLRQLKDYAGKWLVLYFYPRDDTPGCTVEACSFRDFRDDISETTGAEVVGISKDSEASHQKFATKHRLNFPLLSDPEGEVIKAYSAWGKKMYGRKGILRKTFIINPKGMIVKIYGTVTPLGHGQKVLADLKELI